MMKAASTSVWIMLLMAIGAVGSATAHASGFSHSRFYLRPEPAQAPSSLQYAQYYDDEDEDDYEERRRNRSSNNLMMQQMLMQQMRSNMQMQQQQLQRQQEARRQQELQRQQAQQRSLQQSQPQPYQSSGARFGDDMTLNTVNPYSPQAGKSQCTLENEARQQCYSRCSSQFSTQYQSMDVVTNRRVGQAHTACEQSCPRGCFTPSASGGASQ